MSPAVSVIQTVTRLKARCATWEIQSKIISKDISGGLYAIDVPWLRFLKSCYWSIASCLHLFMFKMILVSHAIWWGGAVAVSALFGLQTATFLLLLLQQRRRSVHNKQPCWQFFLVLVVCHGPSDCFHFCSRWKTGLLVLEMSWRYCLLLNGFVIWMTALNCKLARISFYGKICYINLMSFVAVKWLRKR